MDGRKNVTLSDLAAELGVSTVTVSKAMAGQKGVSEELRIKIQSLAKERGYEKNEKKAEKNRPYTIGVIVAERYLEESQSFYWKLYQYLTQQAMQQKKCLTVFEVIDAGMEKNLELPHLAAEKRADGLIVMGAFRREYAAFTAEHAELPLLFLDARPVGAVQDAVVSDNVNGGSAVTDYLLRLGHSKIAFVGTLLATNSIDERYLGYLKSLMEHGIVQRADWVIEDRGREDGRMDPEQYFRLPQEMPTAFFCNCDLTAGILIHKLTGLGIRVPEDVSVAGFDHYQSKSWSTSGLATYEIDMKEMAVRAVHIMIHKIENTGYTSGIFMLGGSLVEGSSVRKIGAAVPYV